MKVKLNKMSLVANWSWSLGDNDHCTICMNPFECSCPQCKFPGDDCPPIEGKCGHIFHLHCIYKWLENGNEKCPLDREIWKEKTESIVNNRNLQNEQGENNNINNNNDNNINNNANNANNSNNNLNIINNNINSEDSSPPFVPNIRDRIRNNESNFFGIGNSLMDEVEDGDDIIQMGEASHFYFHPHSPRQQVSRFNP